MPKKINETHDYGNAARIVNLPPPVSASEPARLAELNNVVAAFTWETPTRVAATTNVNTASPGAAIDGVTLANGDRVLLTAQTTATQNGAWVFNGGSNAMTRATDSVAEGSIFPVEEGSANGATIWMLITPNPVPGTTALTFTQIGRMIQAGTGLTLVGNVLSLTSPVAVATGGTGATSASGARTNLGAVGKFAADFGDGAASSFAIDHNLNTLDAQVAVFLKSTGAVEDCSVVMTSANRVTLSSEGWAAAPPGAGSYRVVVLG